MAAADDAVEDSAHGTERVTGGGNILYMDGHVEFGRYAGEKWPMSRVGETVSQNPGPPADNQDPNVADQCILTEYQVSFRDWANRMHPIPGKYPLCNQPPMC